MYRQISKQNRHVLEMPCTGSYTGSEETCSTDIEHANEWLPMQFITSVIIVQSEQHIVQRKLEGLLQYKKLHGMTHNEEKMHCLLVL